MIRKLTYLIIAAASLLMTACSVFDDHMYGPNGEQKVNVSFVLALGPSGSPVTRAETWDPDDPTDDGDDKGYNPKTIGDGYDNMIDPGTLQVVFYENTSEGAFVGQVTIKGYYPVDSKGNRIDTDADGYMPEDNISNLYHFDGTLMADEGVLTVGTDYKMVVYANLPQSQATRVSSGVALSTLTDLSFVCFDHEEETRDVKFIPMWGVRTVSLTLSETDELQNLGTIYVLRAMAKVEVKLSASLVEEGYTLTSITMNNLNAHGHCLPEGAETVSDTEKLQIEDCIFPKTDHQIESHTDPDGVMYVPEYVNVLAASPATLNVTIQHNDNGTITEFAPETAIEFKNYVDGKPSGSAYDIERNHNYVFEITSISSDLKFLVTIEDLEFGGRYGFEF